MQQMHVNDDMVLCCLSFFFNYWFVLIYSIMFYDYFNIFYILKYTLLL